MTKIKILEGYGASELQNNVDRWLKKEKPVVLSTSIARSDGRSLSLSIVYRDNSEEEIHNLLKS